MALRYLEEKAVESFREKIYAYYACNKREFPWRNTSDPYRILVSEFMLQQTQTSRVMPKYLDFIEAFPTIGSLADSEWRDVVTLWKGLGYYRRALRLLETARTIAHDYGGHVPCDRKVLLSLPGIGPYTAGAMRAFAFGIPDIVIDTNIRALYIHFFYDGKGRVKDAELSGHVWMTCDKENPREWYYALMDYGATIKKTCGNISKISSSYRKQTPFEGSRRQIRAEILKVLVTGDYPLDDIAVLTDRSKEHVVIALKSLMKDGTVHKYDNKYRL